MRACIDLRICINIRIRLCLHARLWKPWAVIAPALSVASEMDSFVKEELRGNENFRDRVSLLVWVLLLDEALAF